MGPGRIAFAIVILWSAACLTLAAVTFINLRHIEPPERYIALGLGLAMLYLGGSPLAGLIWPPKAKDPSEPIEVPVDEVRDSTSYRDDSMMVPAVMLVIGAIVLAASLSAAREQPIVLVFAVVATGILAGAGVKIWRLTRWGRERLEDDDAVNQDQEPP